MGGQISDTATLSGGNAPTGTLAFNVYGPGDTSCATSLRTLTATVSGDGTYTPAGGFRANNGAGTYRWIASYSGDVNNNAISGKCGDRGESTAVIDKPTLSTFTTPSVLVNNQISDTPSGRRNPVAQGPRHRGV